MEALSVSQNPTAGQFLVKLELSSDENVQVNILDITGRVVAKAADTTAGKQFSFDLSDQPTGVYLLKLTIGGNTLARRVVLAR